MIKVIVTKNKIPQLEKELIYRIVGGIELAGMGVERAWKQTARVDTGRYKSSIGHWVADLVKPNPKASPNDSIWDLQNPGSFVQLYVGTNVEYAASLEGKYPNQGGANAIKITEGLIKAALFETMGEAFTIL